MDGDRCLPDERAQQGSGPAVIPVLWRLGSMDGAQTRLHEALKTEVVKKLDGDGLEVALVELQHGRDDTSYSLHVCPSSYTADGAQTTDLLALAGFQRGRCGFLTGRECYAKDVDETLDPEVFAPAFVRAYGAFRQAEHHLETCGILLDLPEGWGFFRGRHSRRRQRGSPGPSGDGHTSSRRERVKDASDERFAYVFTWIEGGRDRGWTTHYRPMPLPLSPEVRATFDYLGLREFEQCPEFDFAQCFWRFVAFENDDAIVESNAGFAHRGFDSHATHFSAAIERLLEVHRELVPFGMSFLHPIATSPTGTSMPEPSGPRPTLLREGSVPYAYDVAISFAGTERALAEKLAERVRAADFEVYYDDFSPAHMWGKDLIVYFDDIYRRKSRYCVIFISKEYVERVWTNHERRSAQARALQERGREYILPVQVDTTELPGMPPTVHRLQLKEHSIERIADLLIQRLRQRG